MTMKTTSSSPKQAPSPSIEPIPAVPPSPVAERWGWLKGLEAKQPWLVLTALLGGILLATVLNLALSVTQEPLRLEALADEQAVSEPRGSEAGAIEGQDHEHLWIPNTQTIHHEAVIEEIPHEPVYGTEVALHTVCNQCGAIIDGTAVDHIEATGHSGYSTKVPVERTVMASEAYTESVVVEEAWDETVTTGAICTKCGQTG